MAKMFYTAEEAASRLGRDDDGIKTLVREGKLREFRDGDSVNYKAQDVEAIAGAEGESNNGSDAGASASGELILEPVEDSSVALSPSMSDVISLEETDSTDTASGTTAIAKAKGDTAVPSVGINVFDDDDLDEHVDPLAQTAVTDLAGLGLDSAGSGSGILDLTRESDDTSLGQELLDEIYTDESEESGAGGSLEMGDATRAGLEEVVPDEEGEEAEVIVEVDDAAEPVAVGATVRQVVEYGPDAVSSGLTALLVVGVAVMLVGGLAAAALVRGVLPSLLESLYANLWMFAAGAVVIGAVAAAVSYVVAKRSG